MRVFLFFFVFDGFVSITEVLNLSGLFGLLFAFRKIGVKMKSFFWFCGFLEDEKKSFQVFRIFRKIG